MKSKRNTYLLLVAVLGIWGVIAYRFFSYAAPDEPATREVPVAARPLPAINKDTTLLNVGYRDPFLGKFYDSHTTGTKRMKRRAGRSINPAPEPIAWPLIKYIGMVSDQKDKRKVFMLSINGKTVLAKENMLEQGVTLLAGNRKAITVSYRGLKKNISISE